MNREIEANENGLMQTGRQALSLDEAEKVTGGYWIIDGKPKKKDPEPGGGSGGW